MAKKQTVISGQGIYDQACGPGPKVDVTSDPEQGKSPVGNATVTNGSVVPAANETSNPNLKP